MLMTTQQWWDSYRAQPNIVRELLGKTCVADGVEQKIVDVTAIDVGLDYNGIFVAIAVVLDSGLRVSLFHDGCVHDDDDVRIGHHKIRNVEGSSEEHSSIEFARISFPGSVR
jgi:hypothetical protein